MYDCTGLFFFPFQTAALDEIFGNQDESFTKYQSAQIIFHSLSQSVVDVVKFRDDINRIQKLQEAVEQRLVHLNSIGYGYMYDTIVANWWKKPSSNSNLWQTEELWFSEEEKDHVFRALWIFFTKHFINHSVCVFTFTWLALLVCYLLFLW